tara:strand:+ start:205 stop:438 length:234 start_codon:yes stop_codon:yes gene_type:complete
MVGQLYLCPKYKGDEEPNIKVISVELFVHLYNNDELPDPEYLIVTTSIKDMAEAIYGDPEVPLDWTPLNGGIQKLND